MVCLVRHAETVRLTEEESRRRLAAARVARLGTSGSDGQPHLVPITFAVDGDRIYTAVDHKPKSTTELRRLRNISQNPRIGLLADHYDDDWATLWWVRVDGLARILIDGAERERALDLLSQRYEPYRATRPSGPVIMIAAERWVGWASSGGRQHSGS